MKLEYIPHYSSPMGRNVPVRKNKQPLEQAVVIQMRDILDRIESGEYQHQQDSWHCGTKHCFFGWKVMQDVATLSDTQSVLQMHIDQKTEGISLILVSEDTEAFSRLSKKATGIDLANIYKIRAYVKSNWRLSRTETSVLASGINEFADIAQFVEAFESGYRLENCPNWEGRNDFRPIYYWVKANGANK